MGLRTIGANASSIGKINRSIVLSVLLHSDQPLTKAEIASQTELVLPTISNICSNLMTEGLIIEAGVAKSKGGPKPVLFSINPFGRYFLGVDIRIGEFTCLLIDLSGNIVEVTKNEFQIMDEPSIVLDQVIIAIDKLLQTSKVEIEKIGGIGISSPGPVDNQQGMILSPPTMTKWRNVPITEIVKRKFDVPCFLERDADAAAFAEMQHGTSQGALNLIYIMAETGIGSGIIINSEIYTGSWTGAGEIGHTRVMDEGPLCDCGKYGCVEAVASAPALRSVLSRKLSRAISIQELYELLDLNPEEIMDSVSKAARYLGMAIGNMCNLLNPEIVILGGALFDHCVAYFNEVIRTAREQILDDFSNRILFTRAQLGEYGCAVGAAKIALQNVIGLA